ncbi:hypothetical protein ACVWZ4_007036 [Bradyrhizobium sp. USDA 4472]
MSEQRRIVSGPCAAMFFDLRTEHRLQPLLDEPLLLRVRIDEIGPDDLRLYLTSLGTIALRAA